MLFIILTVSGGFGIPLYFILWIILPEAKTAGDRLAMRGEPANVSNIGRIIQEEFAHMSKKMSEFGEELKSEFSKKKSEGNAAGESSSDKSDTGKGDFVFHAASEGAHFLENLIRQIVQVAAAIIRPLLFVIGVALLLALALVWIITVAGVFFGMPLTSHLMPDAHWLTVLGTINLLLALGIPVLMLMLAIMRLFLRAHFQPRWAVGLWAFWLLNVASLMFVGSKVANDFAVESTISKALPMEWGNPDTLQVLIGENPYQPSWLHIGDVLYTSGDKLVLRQVKLRLEKSPSNDFELLVDTRSRGRDREKAERLASAIELPIALEGNTLHLPSWIVLGQGAAWRNQRATIILRIPEGKWLELKSMGDLPILELDRDDNYHCRSWGGMLEGLYYMGPEGLICYDQLRRDDHFHIGEDIRSVEGRGPVSFLIRRGAFPVAQISRGEEFGDRVRFEQRDGLLRITADDSLIDEDVEVEVLLPSVERLVFANAFEAEVEGFKLASLDLTCSGEVDLYADLEVDDLRLTLDGECEADLSGKGRQLQARLSDQAQLDAEDFDVKTARLQLSNSASVNLASPDTVYQSTCADCQVSFHGKPVVLKE